MVITVHFSFSNSIPFGLTLFSLSVLLSLGKSEEGFSSQRTLPILTNSNRELDEVLKCNVGNNNNSSSARIKDVSGGNTGCLSGGRSLEGEGLLGGVLRLLKTCVLNAECYRRRLLLALDRALESDSLRLADGVYLVKEYHHEQRFESGGAHAEPFLTSLARRLIRLLETHALRVRLGVMKDSVPESRGFVRGYRHAFPMMVGSFMLLAAITVPMGFQFLAVVGGKALILSQIALFLAMGGHLQRYLGMGAAAPAGGFVQHDYYLRDGLHPWHRDSSDADIVYLPQQQEHHQHQNQQHQQQQHISHQQLQGYMNQRRD